jgi:hypothetical protein
MLKRTITVALMGLTMFAAIAAAAKKPKAAPVPVQPDIVRGCICR